ncbi:efflux RND transporter periplasmic adaptor subunit [Aquabacterium sp.]|uniref:efflux RND transporter periplasmic adaptor subunit n=1 Tax=Aquabacterium sp. TaxID=1872578 RepID=UPI0025B98949|nr:efflux RND transporter periplasmic adaptor subunit [Aquabacterium sp.]
MSSPSSTPETAWPIASDKRPIRRARRWGLLTLALLLTGAGVRTYVNVAQAKSVESSTHANALKTVLFTHPKPGQGQRTVALPATLRGQNEAAIYARTNGYVKAWKKDIGDKVKKGDVLALIDTPEVDQDLAQAKATLEQIRARLALTQSSLQRWEGLRQRDAVSQQELDERRAAQQQASADLAASQANVRRLQQLHDFGRIVAPFDGVVVRRNVDVGALVAAGSASNTKELFYLAQSDALRLTVAVPQVYVGDVSVGKEVSVKLIEKPNAPFKGSITRVSGGVDVATRSVQVEVSLPNKDGKLLPGAYVEVALPLSGSTKALLVPPNTLQFRQDGPRVAVIAEGDKIALRQVKLGRDLGRAVEVTAGLSPKDEVILNPHDTIEEGERVAKREVPPEPKPQQGSASKS